MKGTRSPLVAILDAGGQYVDLVRKACERLGYPTTVLPLDTPAAVLEENYKAIIISGSPANLHEYDAPMPDPTLWQSQLPVLGICFGMQSMAVAHGAAVTKSTIREDGRVTTRVDTTHPIFQGIKAGFVGLFTHGGFVTKLPDNFTAIGQHTLSSGTTIYSAIAKGNKVGVQFHPEVFDDTPEGYQLFKNFFELIANLQPDKNFRQQQLRELIATKQEQIKEQVGDRQVIAFVSGGVDSSVAFTLAASVISAERIQAFYIDSGFMRDEDDLVIESLQAAGLPVTKIEACEKFAKGTTSIDGQLCGPLNSVVDPEEKRKIIGKVFVDIQNDLVAGLKISEALLLQGTNAADRIESGHSIGGNLTMTIKTHHNQVREVQELKAAGLLLEPIDDLFKDEVRELGGELGLPDDLVQRQPFPGPGTAIRIICSKQSDQNLQEAPEQDTLQAFVDLQTPKAKVYLLPIRSVGVGGDERSHLQVAAIEHGDLDANQLALLGTQLPAHFRDIVNRVIYALGPQPLVKHFLVKTLLNADTRSQLRVADKIVFEEMRSADLLSKIKQFPIILLPLSFNKNGERAIVLRPVTTSTFMTVQAMLPGRDLPVDFFAKITDRILAEVPGISQVFLDLTNKPPATTEWE